MIKPTKKVIVEALRYDECGDYIAHKLGVEDLRDFAGKYSASPPNDVSYQNFWHVVLKHNDVQNGSFVWINSEYDEAPEWAMPIIKAFEEEFGEDAEYWVEW